MIRPTDVAHDLQAIKTVIDDLLPLLKEHGQLSVTSRPGAENPLTDAIGWRPDDVRESDYSVVNKEFKGGPVEELLNKLPFKCGRVRIMLMRPKSSLSIHADSTRRYHYAVQTKPDCFIVEMMGDRGKFHHIPADGCVYEMDAFRNHTALNTGRSDRVHIVICSADEEEYQDADQVGRVKNVTANS
jgi:hypothetical protein